MCCLLDADAAGDPKSPAELSLTAIQQSGAYAPIPDGGHVELIRGGQGAFMFVINVKATNVELCGARLQAQLFEPSGFSEGTTDVTRSLVLNEDGTASIDGTDPRQALFFPVCPDREDDAGWKVNVTLTDKSGKQASASATVFANPCECRRFDPSCDGGL